MRLIDVSIPKFDDDQVLARPPVQPSKGKPTSFALPKLFGQSERTYIVNQDEDHKNETVVNPRTVGVDNIFSGVEDGSTLVILVLLSENSIVLINLFSQLNYGSTNSKSISVSLTSGLLFPKVLKMGKKNFLEMSTWTGFSWIMRWPNMWWASTSIWSKRIKLLWPRKYP